jgi:hypothetical protein
LYFGLDEPTATNHERVFRGFKITVSRGSSRLSLRAFFGSASDKVTHDAIRFFYFTAHFSPSAALGYIGACIFYCNVKIALK